MVNREQALLLQAGLFEADWYESRYPDVHLSHLAPFEHFMHYGWRLGRCPGPAFDPNDYAKRYPDVAASGLDPLRHYLLFGIAEGRQGSRKAGGLQYPVSSAQGIAQSGLFDGQWYNDEYQDVAESGVDPLQHYIHHGGRERRDPGPNFDTLHYLRQCPDARNDDVPLLHYLRHGKTRGVSPVPRRSATPWWASLPHSPKPFSTESLRSLASHASAPVIVLPVLAAAPSLRACLEALARYTQHACRIIVLNDTNDPQVAQVLEQCASSPPFECFYHAEPIGRQACIEKARMLANGADIVLLTPQILVSPGWLARLRVAAYQESTTASVSPLVGGKGEDIAQGGRFVAQRADWKTEALASPDERCCYLRADCTTLGRHLQDLTVWVGSSDQKPVSLALPAQQVKRRALYVLSTRTGGTPQTNQDLMSALEDEWECFVLRCNTRVVSLLYFAEGVYTEVQRYRLATPLHAFPHHSAEYDAVVASWLRRYAIELVHVRHIAWHSLGLLKTAHSLGIPLVFSFHDFYALCPSVKLLDEQQRFCAGNCTPTPGECGQELWPSADVPPLKHAAIHEWQHAFRQVLGYCDAFITTTESAKRYVVERYPESAAAPFKVIPHGRDFQAMHRIGITPSADAPLRMVFPGNLTQAKGGHIIAELARTVSAQTLEIHVLGHVAESIKLPANVIQHGGYTREEFVARIQAINPHVGGVLSIWPETFCHTLTELWSCGLPVIGLDIGAVGDRIKASGGGWVTDSFTAQAVLSLVNQARQPEKWQQAEECVLQWQHIAWEAQRCQDMAEAYAALYTSVGQQRFAAQHRRQWIPVLCK